MSATIITLNASGENGNGKNRQSTLTEKDATAKLYIVCSDAIKSGVIEYYKHNKNYKDELFNNNVIASPYITDLLLFRGRKFHLRMYYIISCINGVINSFLLDNGKITAAKEKFDLNIPFTKEKHDSHLKSTEIGRAHV